MNKRAQSIVEYALISILVILGIYFMGTYALRSVNAHFKLWDEGVQDSFEENITQAPLNDTMVNGQELINTTNCAQDCVLTRGYCGSAQIGSHCPTNQREWYWHCPIQGCNGAAQSSCIADPTC